VARSIIVGSRVRYSAAVPFTISFDATAGGVVTLTQDGPVSTADFELGRRGLIDAVAAGANGVLLDLRGVHEPESVLQRFLDAPERRSDSPVVPIALLCHPGHLGAFRALAASMEASGVPLRVFTHPDRATTWLATT
jgi:hypothetical protein